MTAAGRAVLAGDRNRLEAMGIDRRIGGVHLSAEDGNVWVRDGDELRTWGREE